MTSSTGRATDCDVLVVGGGPVGLAAAIRARLAGFDVVLVERHPGVLDKACGEGLMPGAVAALTALGVEPSGFDLRGIAYLRDGQSVRHTFRAGPGRGVRRTTLHAALLARADGVGVSRVSGNVRALHQGPGWVEVDGRRARWVLACDGLASPVRGLLGLDRPMSGRARFGLRQHFSVAAWSDLVEVHWSPRAEAYVTPVSSQLVGVAVLGPPAGAAPHPTQRARDGADRQQTGMAMGAGLLERISHEFPALAERLQGVHTASAVRGAGPLRRSALRVQDGRVLLVGDAAGYVDALTGEGIRVGLAQAEAAVAAVLCGRPQAYVAAWAGVTRDYRWLTQSLLAVTGRPLLRRGLVPAAARLPGVFGAAVERLAG